MVGVADVKIFHRKGMEKAFDEGNSIPICSNAG